MTARLLSWLIGLYQAGTSPLLGGGCRFTPTCSCYARQALLRHGSARGLSLTVRRILRCHPWGGCGADPVP